MCGRADVSRRRFSQILLCETHHTYTPSDARAARALCGDDASVERAPRVRVVKETLWGVLAKCCDSKGGSKDEKNRYTCCANSHIHAGDAGDCHGGACA